MTSVHLHQWMVFEGVKIVNAKLINLNYLLKLTICKNKLVLTVHDISCIHSNYSFRVELSFVDHGLNAMGEHVLDGKEDKVEIIIILV